MIEAIIHGIVLAFGLILPLGVQNVFIFNQGATQPTLFRAFPAVLTASVCDTLLILLAVLGVSLIVLTLTWLKTMVFGIGFLFLIYMGWVIWKGKPASVNHTEARPLSAKKQIVFAASVSLLNPHAIMDTVGVIGTNSLTYAGDDRWAFTLATMIVSWLWFWGLAIAGRAVGRLDDSGRVMQAMNRLSALVIWGVALYMGWTLIF
ncbi:L-lysine exporter family protein LysE/ArgO [Caldalkalibacillus uzonensis]|uniref:L-lysine exporter family protein LysE/ArgO n=1 Tax=Caldalkalibacillus uzonensis TaxID=353224 RepID=A0ABU0CX98_9BACI|nr:LysE/ArgO family amino acid transporter [Caldalkalibacillus uzonensis]MDQ0339797.1 L-lysine exporter family protein LysE/ArgO [Caldalkalibacillus uzonensis]